MRANFRNTHRLAQGAFFGQHHPEESGFRGSAYRLEPQHRGLNLAPVIQEQASAYFAEKGIAWHLHANHGLSSQVCCLNYLMPLAFDPATLSRIIGRAFRIDPPEILAMEQDAAGRDWFVAFEWIGLRDYLNEWPTGGAPQRGANVTSADAAIRFRHGDKIEIALIEWKFSESYGAPLSPDGNEKRRARYADISFGPTGPIRNDLGVVLDDFFWEPFYQMLRQQMLALGMQRDRELGAEHVRVLHISPAENADLHKVTAPTLRSRGSDAFDVFRGLLIDPSAFVGWSIEGLFTPLLSDGPAEWSKYLRSRYASFCGSLA